MMTKRTKAAPAAVPAGGLSAGAEPLIVAHRGASQDAPENTIPAFKLAWDQGADAVEADVHLTRDNEIVCIHDKDTKKAAGKKLVVKDSTLEELRKLKVESRFGEQWKGIGIPTISEALAVIPDGKKIYIEIKCGSEILPRLLEELGTSGLKRDQVVVMSFNSGVIRDFKVQTPTIKALWLSSFKTGKPLGGLKPSLERVLKTLNRIRADGFSSTSRLIDRAFIKGVLDQGYEYHVWTVDDLKTAQRFKDWGAMSITTNVPGYLKKNLAKS